MLTVHARKKCLYLATGVAWVAAIPVLVMSLLDADTSVSDDLRTLLIFAIAVACTLSTSSLMAACFQPSEAVWRVAYRAGVESVGEYCRCSARPRRAWAVGEVIPIRPVDRNVSRLS